MLVSENPNLERRKSRRKRVGRAHGDEIKAFWAAHFIGHFRGPLYSAGFAFTATLLLGGGTANTYLTNAFLQILTLPSLVYSLWILIQNDVQFPAKSVLYLIGAAVILIVVQLIPLPPAVWSSLPLHEGALAARRAIGSSAQWAPVSISPDATIVGALTLLPPLAVFLGVLGLSAGERRLLTLVALSVGLVSAFVGLLQRAQGEDSALYFYAYSGREDSVGLLTNRNHQAALLYSLLPFGAAWIATILPELSMRRQRQRYDTTAIIKLLSAGVTVCILIVATLMTRSRAGLILLMAALAGSLAMQPWRNSGGIGTLASKIFAVIAVLSVMLGLQYGFSGMLARFETDSIADARVQFARQTAVAALRALPLGTGIGTFVPIYASIERPEDLISDVYVNHAHNDFLEFALETGIPGVLLLGCFFIWFFFRIRDIWRGVPDPDRIMARAASLSIGLLVIHALVDYALRSDTIMAIFAFACALLVPPPQRKAEKGADA